MPEKSIDEQLLETGKELMKLLVRKIQVNNTRLDTDDWVKDNDVNNLSMALKNIQEVTKVAKSDIETSEKERILQKQREKLNKEYNK